MIALKVCLWIMGVLCLVVALIMALPFESMQAVMGALGEQPLPDSPVLIHVLRACAATYFAVGVLYIVLAWSPQRYGVLVPLFGAGAVLFGVVCGVSGLAAKLPTFWYAQDAVSGIVLGILIIVFWQQACGSKGAG